MLRLLIDLAAVRAASVWAPDEGRRAHRLLGTDDEGTEDRSRAAAEELLTDRSARVTASDALLAVPVLRYGRTAAVLVVLPEGSEHARVRPLVEEAAAALAIVLERELLLTRGAARERRLSETGERRLARLAFDIHDGPLQDLIALGSEVTQLRSQLPALLGDRVESRIAVGRVDDVLARLGSLESELRGLSAGLEPAVVGGRPLPESLA
ncbi:MAG: hypothetical protein M3310_02065, partial [Actinomycetota bacterium]|nr:hypothetical protein [Actinomycetota bacterium]